MLLKYIYSAFLKEIKKIIKKIVLIFWQTYPVNSGWVWKHYHGP